VSDLLNAVLDAYGGLDNWRQFDRVQATIVTGGGLWTINGQPQVSLQRRMTALHHEWASLQPFGADDQKTAFTPDAWRSKSSMAESFPSGLTLGNHSTGTSLTPPGTRCIAPTSTATKKLVELQRRLTGSAGLL
jgi:hypothetical protein